MSDVRQIIARGKTLTGRKLRQAIESATGKIVGGRGIKVVTLGRQSVVSLKGRPIIGGGGGPGQSVPGIITEVSPPDGPNSDYKFRSLDSTSMPEVTVFMAPNNRTFGSEVDFDPAEIGEYIRIWAIWPAAFPLVSPVDETTGACITTAGACTVKALAECDGDDVFYPGEPCAFIDVTEHVQTTQCTAPLAGNVLPPPPVLSPQELLT